MKDQADVITAVRLITHTGADLLKLNQRFYEPALKSGYLWSSKSQSPMPSDHYILSGGNLMKLLHFLISMATGVHSLIPTGDSLLPRQPSVTPI